MGIDVHCAVGDGQDLNIPADAVAVDLAGLDVVDVAEDGDAANRTDAAAADSEVPTIAVDGSIVGSELSGLDAARLPRLTRMSGLKPAAK
jgi:hypothetical protein